jgi:hypothetical protein
VSGQHPDREDLALAALPAETPDPRIVAHLADCPTCRAHVADLTHTVALAKEGTLDAGEPVAPERMWAAIVAELGSELGPLDGGDGSPIPQADGPGLGLVDVGPRPVRVTGRRPWWRAAAVPVAAALVALAIGVGLGVGLGRDTGGGPSPTSTVVAQLRPVGTIDPAGTGTMSAAQQGGVSTMVIQLSGVTDTGGADYLEAWLMNPDGTQIVALGALTRDDNGYNGSFTVPANLPLTQLDVVDISAEHYDNNPAHSGLSILRGTLS